MNKQYETLFIFNKYNKELIEMKKKYENNRLYLYGIDCNVIKNNSIKSNSYLSNFKNR
jgi:hypothetical protein